MTRIYEILAWTGWIWAAICFAYIGFRLQRDRRSRQQRGFPVIPPDEKSES